jgi:di/tricarboxylate transporter
MIAMMLPILRLWSLRLGFDVAQLAMPMGFASQLGGSLTLMGSPTNFAAKSAFHKFGYMFGFFELSFPAAILFLLGLVFSVVFAPLLLGRRSLGLDDHAVDARKPVEAFFQVAFTVQARGTFDGLKVSLAGFTRLPGIRSVESVIRDNIFIDLEKADETLVGGDHILFRASADGIVGLRSTRGLWLPYEPELQRLGANRRERAVFEVELLETSALIGVPLTMRSLCFTHKCAILAVRKQLGKVDESRLQYESHSFTPSWNDSSSGDRGSSTGPRQTFFPRLTFNDYIPSRGDVFLVEANCSEVDCDPWLRDFGLVRMIGGSTPPRIGRLQDRLRSILVILGSILAICLYVVGDVAEQPYNPALRNLTLTNNLLLLMAVFLIAKVFTIQEVYESMDVSVLMTIVGAFPFGLAIENVGLAEWTAQSLVNVLGNFGQGGIFVAIYIVSAGLSNLISNIAVIVMMAPVCNSITHLQHISLRPLVVLVTLAASAVFTCPIGHQTNLMIWPVGKYTWGDFFRYGFPWQLVHMVACVFICAWLL